VVLLLALSASFLGSRQRALDNIQGLALFLFGYQFFTCLIMLTVTAFTGGAHMAARTWSVAKITGGMLFGSAVGLAAGYLFLLSQGR
jgi:hypothetical protein